MHAIFVVAAVVMSTRAVAANPPPPDEDFLAYLGSWDGDDEDWQMVQAAIDAESPSTAPAPRQQQTRRTSAESAAQATQEQKK